MGGCERVWVEKLTEGWGERLLFSFYTRITISVFNRLQVFGKICMKSLDFVHPSALMTHQTRRCFFAMALQMDVNACSRIPLDIKPKRMGYSAAMNKKQISCIAAALGKLGGSVKSKAKAAAARKNGKLGGRPKKVKKP